MDNNKTRDTVRLNVYLPREFYAEFLKHRVLKKMSISQYLQYLFSLHVTQENNK